MKGRRMPVPPGRDGGVEAAELRAPHQEGEGFDEDLLLLSCACSVVDEGVEDLTRVKRRRVGEGEGEMKIGGKRGIKGYVGGGGRRGTLVHVCE